MGPPRNKRDSNGISTAQPTSPVVIKTGFMHVADILQILAMTVKDTVSFEVCTRFPPLNTLVVPGSASTILPSRILRTAADADASELETVQARIRTVLGMVKQIHRANPISWKDRRKLAEKLYMELGDEPARRVLSSLQAPGPDVSTTTHTHTIADGAVGTDME